MSGPPGGGNGLPAPRSSSNGSQGVGLPMPPQHQANGAQLAGAGSGSGPNGNMSQQDLNSIVSDQFLGTTYPLLPLLLFRLRFNPALLNLLHTYLYGIMRSHLQLSYCAVMLSFLLQGQLQIDRGVLKYFF